jgi:Polyketide cyclase / dehydrase and lipid transport
MNTQPTRWGEYGPRPVPLAENSDLFETFALTETVEVSCSPAEAWRLVSNVERIGEFSPECVSARWLDSATGPTVGARFEGTNRVVVDGDEAVWIRPCVVTAVVSGEYFAYVVGDRFNGTAAAEWAFRVEATTDGTCTITHSFRHMPDGLSGTRSQADAHPEAAVEILRRRAIALQDGMRKTLGRMRNQLELASD